MVPYSRDIHTADVEIAVLAEVIPERRVWGERSAILKLPAADDKGFDQATP